MLKLISVDHKYSDNNGAWTEFYCWTGTEVVTFGSMYGTDEREHLITDDLTEDELQAAKAWIFENTEEKATYNKYCYNRLGATTYLGCIVTLKRSRKAPNNVDLKVIEFHESYYNKQFNNHVAEQVTVTDGINCWTVSSNCIDKLVKGTKKLPYWY